jgi:tetratricopeptide (TPR) repeat protein
MDSLWVKISLGLVLAVLSVCCLRAQSLNEQIRRAAELNDEGEFSQTVRLLAPLLEAQGENNDPIFGIIWNLYGSALQSTGDQEKARRGYERAIELLRRAPTEQAHLASALDNLGSLKAEMGQLSESQSLRIRARSLYQSMGDDAGVARASTNLALVALSQRKLKGMRQFLKDAFAAEAQVATPDAGDLAALYSTQALERNASRDPRGALICIDKAIQVWTERYGRQYYLLTDGYSLRGQLEAELNDREQAVNDCAHSLEILRQHGDHSSRTYFLVEVGYARVLRHFGMVKDADQLEEAAQRGLDSTRNSCPGCSISADSFR